MALGHWLKDYLGPKASGEGGGGSEEIVSYSVDGNHFLKVGKMVLVNGLNGDGVMFNTPQEGGLKLPDGIEVDTDAYGAASPVLGNGLGGTSEKLFAAGSSNGMINAMYSTTHQPITSRGPFFGTLMFICK